MELIFINNKLTISSFTENQMIYEQINTIAPSKLWQAYINQKLVYLNDKPLVYNQKVNHDSIVSLQLPEETIDYACDKDSMPIVYEDDIFLIVNKPKDIIIYDVDKNAQHTLCSHVAKYYQQTNQSHGIHYVHRLDKDTTGCCIFIKHQFFVPGIDGQIRNRSLKRNYIALAHGRIEHDLTIDQPIGRNRHDKKLRRVDPNGQQAKTDVKVLGYIGNNTLIQCDLHTGRTHQIRVHLSYIGHPLVGDSWYGKADRFGLCLHSYHVQVIHPITLKPLHVFCHDIPFLTDEQIHKFKL